MEVLGRIDLDQNSDRWRAVVKTVMKPRASQNAGNFLTTGKTISFFLGVSSSSSIAAPRRTKTASGKKNML